MTRTVARALILVGALAVAWATWEVLARQSQVPAGWRFSLPPGNPSRGEGVFTKLGCGSCHNVAGRDLGSAGKQSQGVGPDLTHEQAALSAEYLAERLITPDRFLPHGLFKATHSQSDGSSRMYNFNEEMSVRELIDLVAFLKSI